MNDNKDSNKRKRKRKRKRRSGTSPDSQLHATPWSSSVPTPEVNQYGGDTEWLHDYPALTSQVVQDFIVQSKKHKDRQKEEFERQTLLEETQKKEGTFMQPKPNDDQQLLNAHVDRQGSPQPRRKSASTQEISRRRNEAALAEIISSDPNAASELVEMFNQKKRQTELEKSKGILQEHFDRVEGDLKKRLVDRLEKEKDSKTIQNWLFGLGVVGVAALVITVWVMGSQLHDWLIAGVVGVAVLSCVFISLALMYPTLKAKRFKGKGQALTLLTIFLAAGLFLTIFGFSETHALAAALVMAGMVLTIGTLVYSISNTAAGTADPRETELEETLADLNEQRNTIEHVEQQQIRSQLEETTKKLTNNTQQTQADGTSGSSWNPFSRGSENTSNHPGVPKVRVTEDDPDSLFDSTDDHSHQI